MSNRQFSNPHLPFYAQHTTVVKLTSEGLNRQQRRAVRRDIAKEERDAERKRKQSKITGGSDK